MPLAPRALNACATRVVPVNRASAVADESARFDAAYDLDRLEHLGQAGGIET